MKKYQSYIIGGILLIAGIIIGKLMSPNTTQSVSTMDHSEHAGHNDQITTSPKESSTEAAVEIWTCSMHPQVRLEEFGICPICEMDLIPLGNDMGSDDPAVLKMSEESAKLAQVETFKIGGSTGKGKTNTSSVKVDGTVELDERTIKSQTVHVAGRIEEMDVTFEGQYVKKGQKIATIYSTALIAASQEVITAAKYENRVEGIKDAAIQKLKNWKVTETQIKEILKTGKPVETIDIYADHAGYVLTKKLSQGDYVNQGSPLYTLGSTSRLWLIFNVFESDLGSVRKGSEVEFTTSSIPNKVFKSKITYIDPLLNSNTRTATVRAEMSNQGNLLKPGMLLDGSIATKTFRTDGKAAVQIPNTAVLWTGNKSVVYVQLPEMEVPTFQFREVEVGDRAGEFIVVNNGLEMGEEVVIHGAFAIDAAAQLNNNMSMMNRNVSIKKENTDVIPDFLKDTPDEFKKQLNGVANAYITLKDAFVATDATKASLAAENVSLALDKTDMTLLKGDGHIYWMEQYEILVAHNQKIIDNDDVESQRKQFDFLSEALINSIQAFGTAGNALYVQHCPMAFNNQGANWIAAEEAIKNPYFGDKMMKCGLVKKSFNTEEKSSNNQ